MLTSLAKYIDYTNLSPAASKTDIEKLCAEARTHGFAAVCINPLWVRTAADALRNCPVAVCTVIGFPLGATPNIVKLFEAQRTLADGAKELDMVINVAALKAGDHEGIKGDIAPLAQAAHADDALLKVILEVALLSDEEIVRGCQWAEESGADFVKTSTGTLKGEGTGATVHTVELMRASVSPAIGVKAAGGIRDRETAEAMIAAGATRIGTSTLLA